MHRAQIFLIGGDLVSKVETFCPGEHRPGRLLPAVAPLEAPRVGPPHPGPPLLPRHLRPGHHLHHHRAHDRLPGGDRHRRRYHPHRSSSLLHLRRLEEQAQAHQGGIRSVTTEFSFFYLIFWWN